MARSVYTVKYMRSQFRKYQLIAIILAVLAIATSLIAAFANIRETALRKEQDRAVELEASKHERLKSNVQKELDRVSKQLIDSEDKLNKEKQTVKILHEQISALQSQISTLKNKIKEMTPNASPASAEVPAGEPQSIDEATEIPSSPLDDSANTTTPGQPMNDQEAPTMN